MIIHLSSDNSNIVNNSSSILTSISNHYPNNELILVIQLMALTTNRQISFMWAPSYVEIHGNEKVDKFANKATTYTQYSTKINKITTTEVRNSFKTK